VELVEVARRVVLDSDVLIDFLRGVDESIKLIEDLRGKGVTLATTSINIFELAWGASKLGAGKLGHVRRLAKILEVLSLSSEEAIKAGEEMGYLELLGLRVDLRDVLIGVIAREHGAMVVTGSVRHFSRIRGLKVLEYRRARV
jgi:predicted nucleic acid-binding protein